MRTGPPRLRARLLRQLARTQTQTALQARKSLPRGRLRSAAGWVVKRESQSLDWGEVPMSKCVRIMAVAVLAGAMLGLLSSVASAAPGGLKNATEISVTCDNGFTRTVVV